MMDKALLYAILKNKSGAEISASGNPVTLSGTNGKPLKDIKIYGWSKQESTTGKNLFDFSRLVSDGVNVMDYKKQTITVPAKTNNTGYNQTLRDLCPGITPGIYVFSMKQSNPQSITGSYFLEAAMDFPINTPIELTDALLDNHISWYNNSDSEIENVISEVQLEAGDTATAYEPYTGVQPSPNPDYPQEIESAGSVMGKIGIEVCGKNLLNFEEYLKTGNVIYTKESEIYQITSFGQAYNNPYKFSDKDIEVTINGIVDDITSKNTRIDALNSSKKIVASVYGKDFQKCKASYIRLNYTKRGTCNIQKVQVERGATATAYEPYHTPQSLSIQTPTGLPAIPVDTGGNYTDANGQQWISDYVDLKRGKYVQNVWQKTFDGSEDEKWKKGSIYYVYSECLPVVMSSRKGFCSQYIVGNDKRGIRIGNGNNALIIFDDFSDENAFSNFKANLSVNPFKVMTYLDDPIERDLTASEIQAYKELVTYAGTTILENDSDCHMEVSSGGGDALRAKKLALILGD